MNEKLRYFINLTNTPSYEWDTYKQGYALTLADEIVDYKLPKVNFYEQEKEENRQIVSICQNILKEYGESFCVFLHEDSSFKEKLRKKFQYYKIDCYWEIKGRKGKASREFCFTPDTFRKFELVTNKAKEVGKCKK